MNTDPGIAHVEQKNDGTFEAPKEIIKKVTASRAIYTRLRADHLSRIAGYAEIYGLVQGNPPYDQTEIDAAGLGHMSNFNDMSFRAIFERACLSYWNIGFNAQTIINFTINIPQFNSPDKVRWAEILSQEWDFAIRTYWPSFQINMASLQSQLVMFGLSPVIFTNERDPRWTVVDLNRFLVPSQAKSDLDKLTIVMVETEMTIQELWGYYKYFKGKDKSPWNLDALGSLLTNWGGQNFEGANVSTFDMLEFEKRMLNGDTFIDRTFSDTIRVISEFQKEYDGRISHYMFTRDSVAGGVGIPEDFLYRVPNQYKNISEALVIFTMNPGESTLHGNRGLGHKCYSLAQAKIQLLCSAVDGAKNATTIFVKGSNLSTKDAEQIRWNPGSATNLGSAELVTNTMGANINASIGTAKYLAGEMQFNMTYSGQDPGQPDPGNGSISPTQARLQAFREFNVLKNYISHFQHTADVLLRNMTAKMFYSKVGWPMYDMAKLWKDRCIAKGVPAEIFEMNKDGDDTWKMPNHLDAAMTRTAGAGSQVGMLIGLQEMKEVINSFGTKGQNTFQRQYVSAALGPEFIDAYVDSDEDKKRITGGASQAAVENGLMALGQPVLFSPDNDQQAHILLHIQKGSEVIQAVVQGQMNPMQAQPIFELLIPHTGEHMNYEGANPLARDFMASVAPQFNQLQEYANLNKRKAAQMLQAQQKQQEADAAATEQVLNEEQRKNVALQGNEQRSNLKLASQLQRGKEMQDVKAQTLEEKTRAELRIKNKKAEGELAIKAKQAGGESPEETLQGFSSATPAPFDIEKANTLNVSGYDPRNPTPPIV